MKGILFETPKYAVKHITILKNVFGKWGLDQTAHIELYGQKYARCLYVSTNLTRISSDQSIFIKH